jgi:hypothetical protein
MLAKEGVKALSQASVVSVMFAQDLHHVPSKLTAGRASHFFPVTTPEQYISVIISSVSTTALREAWEARRMFTLSYCRAALNCPLPPCGGGRQEM